jgi:putative hemolysin
MPWSTPATPKPVEYSTTQSDSPAAKYCTANGGTVSIEKNPNIPSMELIYCTSPGGEKIDAWKYMDMQTTITATGTTGSGIPL